MTPDDAISRRDALDALAPKKHYAHTYASENADLYQGYDNGIAAAREIIKQLPALPPAPEASIEVVMARAVMSGLDVCDDERRCTVIIDALKDERPDIYALDGKLVEVIVRPINAALGRGE